MPKRVGFLYEELIDLELCERAVLIALRNKRKTPYIRYIIEHYKEWGKLIQRIIVEGWVPKPPRKKTINEGTNHKVRNLEIPGLIDHMIHTAVVLVMEKHFMKRYYFWSCGSIPGKGQNFAYSGIRKEMDKKRPPKYAAEADIRKFYDNCTKEVVMHSLRRIIKDEKFLAINEKILDQMGGKLSIGFSVSHWYANLVLTDIDNGIKQNFGRDIHLFRYMDNFVMLGNNKRKLHKAVRLIMEMLRARSMQMKRDWQVFRTKFRPISFLSYRFLHGHVLMQKSLLYRMSRRLRKARINMNNHTARVVMSYWGILKWCDSYQFKQDYFYPNVNLKACRRVIRNHDLQKCALPIAA